MRVTQQMERAGGNSVKKHAELLTSLEQTDQTVMKLLNQPATLQHAHEFLIIKGYVSISYFPISVSNFPSYSESHSSIMSVWRYSNIIINNNIFLLKES